MWEKEKKQGKEGDRKELNKQNETKTLEAEGVIIHNSTTTGNKYTHKYTT